MKYETARNLVKKLTFSLLITGIFCSGISGYIIAQDSNDTLSVVLEEVKIEATHSSITLDKASISVTTLQRSLDDLTARRASTMDELTFTLPGVWVSNRENHALGERMTIRGMGWRSQFGVRGIQVILDDIPLTVADGQTILNMVDPAMVQSMELLRGPSATFWGNSSGGVLFMRTRPPADSPNFMFRSYAGSYNTMKHEARWHDQLGGVRWNAYGSYYDTDGFRDHSAAQLIRGGVSAGFDIGERANLEARLAYAGMPKAEHPGSLPADSARINPSMAWPAFSDNNAGKDFHQWMASGNFLRSFETGLLRVSSHGTYRDLANPLPFGYISVSRLAGGTRSTYDFENLPFQLQIGGEIKWLRDERDQTEMVDGEPAGDVVTDQLDRVNNQALFGKAVFDFAPFSFSLGLRGDRMVFSTDDYIGDEKGSRTFTTLNPSFGITYSLDNARLFANFSTSFESPTTTEFKNRPGGGTGFNPDLDPERAIGLETGIRGFYNNLNLEYDITLFGSLVKDQIVQESIVDGEAVFSNGGSAEHYGIETHFRLKPVNRVSLELMYTWLNAKFSGSEFDFEENYEGNRLPGVAPHRFGSTISVHIGNHQLSTDVEWIGEYYADSENTAINDSYMLVNGRWLFRGFNFEGWSIRPFFSVHNIFDIRYNTSVAINAFGGRYYEPGSGRNFQGGISIQF
jgi:iron complex outermembrane recepter protein